MVNEGDSRSKKRVSESEIISSVVSPKLSNLNDTLTSAVSKARGRAQVRGEEIEEKKVESIISDEEVEGVENEEALKQSIIDLKEEISYWEDKVKKVKARVKVEILQWVDSVKRAKASLEATEREAYSEQKEIWISQIESSTDTLKAEFARGKSQQLTLDYTATIARKTEAIARLNAANNAAAAALVEIEVLTKTRLEKAEEEKVAANKLKEFTAQLNAKASQLKAAALALAQAQAQAQAHPIAAQVQVAVQAVQAAPPLQVLSIASINALHDCSSLEESKAWVDSHDIEANAVMRFLDENIHHITLQQQLDLLTALVLNRGSVFKKVEARNYARTIADLTNYLLANDGKKLKDVTTPVIGKRIVGMVYQILTIGQGFAGTVNSHEQLIEKTGSGFAGEFGRLKTSRKDFNGTLEAKRNLLMTANSQGLEVMFGALQ